MPPSTPSTLVTTTGTTGTGAFATGNVSPSANALVMVLIAATNITTSETAPTISSITSTLSGMSAWTLINSRIHEETNFDAIVAAYWSIAGAAPGTGTVTVNVGPNQYERWTVSVIQVTGAHTTTPITNSVTGTGATATTPSLTLPGSPAATSVVVGMVLSVGGAAVTPGSAYTELIDATSGSSLQTRCEVEYDMTPTGTTVDWSALNTSRNLALAFEIVEAAAAGGTGEAAITLDAATIAASGTLALSGALALTFGAATIAAAGTLAISGAFARALDAATLAATGTLSSTAISGSAAITLGAATLAATGTLVSGASGALNVTLDAATVASAGQLSLAAQAAISLGPATLSSLGTLVIVGAATIQLAAATLSSFGSEVEPEIQVIAVTLYGPSSTSEIFGPQPLVRIGE